MPINYRITRIGDGRSFSRRRVIAYQDGRELFMMQASFHLEETGLAHHHEQPPAPDPSACTPLTGPGADARRWPDMYRDWGCVDVRLAPLALASPRAAGAGTASVAQVWMRTTSPVPPGLVLHSTILACTSDMTLLGAALAPHGISHRHPGYRVASLDHCLWIHAPFRVDEWLLYHQVSPIAARGRGFCRGELYQGGHHVATVVQEGSIRAELSVPEGGEAARGVAS